MAAAAAATSLLLSRHRGARGPSPSSSVPRSPPPVRCRSSPSSPRPSPFLGRPRLPAPPLEPHRWHPLLWRQAGPLRPAASSLLPIVADGPFPPSLAAFSVARNVADLKETFTAWMTEQHWEDMKQLFELWVCSLDVATN
ncbi:hypothetical protein ZWY2020_025631 [Hordeum vulgare]|nr:hypothetical protein ZWY2020_025631 [Hordeum vulgare]